MITGYVGIGEPFKVTLVIGGLLALLDTRFALAAAGYFTTYAAIHVAIWTMEKMAGNSYMSTSMLHTSAIAAGVGLLLLLRGLPLLTARRQIIQ
jgi:hypothetical protein